MPGDDLYGLAQSAGIVPANDEGGGYYGGVDAPQDPGLQGSPQGLEGRQGVMSGGLSPPAVAPMAGGGQVDGSSLPPGVQSGGSSFGHTGFNQGTYNKLATQGGTTRSGLGGDVDRATADAQSKAGAEADRMLAPLDAADAATTRAAAEVAHAQADIQTQNGIEANHFAKLNSDFAAQEAKANADADATSNTAKANYTAALMDLRASRVDPNQLWKSHTGGEQFGMLVSAFVHDFLGAKGIHTSAMDTFNKAIDRNIDAQVNAIKTKGDVAEGFKSLWYMQRSQSASDTEARTRMKGMMLEAATQQATAHMAQYQSALATAQGHAAIAALQEKSATTHIDVYKHVDDNTNALRKQNLDVISDNKKYAIESWKASQEEQRMRAEALKTASAEQAKYIPDNSPAGEGRLRYKFFSGSQDTQDKLKEQIGSLNSFDDEVQQMRALMKEVGSVAPAGVPDFLRSPEGARLLSLRDTAAYNLAYATSGKQINEKEVEFRKSQFPLESWLTRGDREIVLAQTSNNLHKEAFAKFSPFVTEVGPGDPAWSKNEGKPIRFSPTYSPTGDVAPAEPAQAAQQENHTILYPSPTTPEQREFNAAASLIKEPSDKIDQGVGKTSANPWDQFNKEDLDSVDSGANVRDENDKFLKDTFGKDTGLKHLPGELFEAQNKGYNVRAEDFDRPKQFEAGMVRLRDLAKAGKPESQAAINELARWAMGPTGAADGTGDQDDYRGLFALRMLHEVSDTVASPEAVRQEAKKAKEVKDLR